MFIVEKLRKNVDQYHAFKLRYIYNTYSGVQISSDSDEIVHLFVKLNFIRKNMSMV